MKGLGGSRRPDLLAFAIDLVGSDPFERSGDGTAYLRPDLLRAFLDDLEQ